jgi:hypothetical protein
VELRISKLDAARRQLEIAVRLYFSSADPVPIHTLAAAAHRVLSDISKARKGPRLITDTVVDWLPSETRTEARKILNEAANFFKHADNDTDETLRFDPAQTEALLLSACQGYMTATSENVPLFSAYAFWFVIGPGASLVDTTPSRFLTELRLKYRGATRQSYFAEVLPMLSTIPSSGQAKGS